jgi:hypothetical protein
MKGKVALVTGGSSGIGLATAKAFARQGARVVIASRGKAAATAALKELAGAGDATWQPVDVADGKSVARLIATVMGEHGRLDYALQDDRRLSYVRLPLHERRDRSDEAVRHQRDREQCPGRWPARLSVSWRCSLPGGAPSVPDG